MNNKHQTGGDGSTNIQANTVTTNNTTHHNTNNTTNYYTGSLEVSVEEDMGIINEIFEYILTRTPKIGSNGLNNNGNHTNLKEKIKLNFPDPCERLTFREGFHLNWERKNLVEEFFAGEYEVNPLKVNALIDKVQSDFRKIKNSRFSRTKVENNKIIEDLAINYVPQNKRKNPEYLANSKAIILYLFEFCYLGKVTDEEQKKLDDFLSQSPIGD